VPGHNSVLTMLPLRHCDHGNEPAMLAMIRSRSLSWIVFLSTLVGVTCVSGDVDEAGSDQCGLYFALSSKSTDGNKWGVFAGVEVPKGSNIGNPDVVINTLNLRANNLLARDDKARQDQLKKVLEFLEESFWVGDSVGGRFELDEGRIISATPGAGFLGAYDRSMTSSDWNVRQNYRRLSLGDEAGAAHPGRGSNSPFYNCTLMATENVAAGAEIFINYGENWEEEKKDAEELLKTDFDRLDQTVTQMIEFFAKHAKELDETSKKEIYSFITKDVMSAAVGNDKAETIIKILPESPDDLPLVVQAGGTLKYSQPTVFRGLDWLQKNGRCMDNLAAGASTIPNAGRGAFASRAIPKGGVVVASPLLHIPDREVLDMHELSKLDNGEFARKSDDPIGQQLLMNYCYGHPESSMVFLPVSSGINFINHADEPNAKLVWSDHPANHKAWFSMEPMELVEAENLHLGLMIEVVALRDIDPGEEVFIDYGEEWKQTWANHEASWADALAKGVVPTTWPLRAADMNDEYSRKPYKTLEEMKKEPYPKNVALVAFMMLAETDEAGTASDPKLWTHPQTGTVYAHDHLFEVVVTDIVQIDAGEGIAEFPYNYTIRWSNSAGEETYVKNIPHEAFLFVDVPETGDQFVKGAFRHYIGIPDEIFPRGPWRNLAVSEK
jgi:SET domain